ncbi:MAG: ABC transporter permease [Thermaceae bacterium]|nr:ABC transporter permease [Thermaceae bacterium]
MIRLAFRNLFQSKAHLAISVGGVALALMLMLALGAVFTGAEKQITAFIDRAGANVFVAQKGVRNLHMVSSWLPSSVVGEVSSVQGVQSVTPIMYVAGMVDTGKERNLAYIVGLPPDPAMGKAWRVVEGAAAPAPGAIVLDRAVAAQSGLRLGDTVKVLGRQLRIAGLSEGTVSITNSVAFITMDDFERMRGASGESVRTQAVSFVLVKAAPGEEPDALAERIEVEVEGVTAQSSEAFARQERNLVKDMAADVLTIMNLVGFAIGLAVMSLTIYTATLARRAEYGALKALGARSRDLYGAVLTQAVVSVTLGLALGVAFTLGLSALLPVFGSTVALQVSGESLAQVVIASLIIAAVAALLPIRQIAGLDPAAVFRRRIQ